MPCDILCTYLFSKVNYTVLSVGSVIGQSLVGYLFYSFARQVYHLNVFEKCLDEGYPRQPKHWSFVFLIGKVTLVKLHPET